METPYILVDEKIVDSNIKKMSEMARNKKINLRPHIKTHKLPFIAKKQLSEGAIGISVATISEAQIMADGGINDIFIAYPIVTKSKAEKVVQLKQRLLNLIVGVDSLVGAKILNSVAEAHDEKIQVRLEIETGLCRTGVELENAAELAHNIADFKNLIFQGIFTFKGAVYERENTLDLEAAGQEEGKLMLQVAENIRKIGVEVNNISVGSTPTAATVAKVKGITEVRPGTYVFNDVMQVHFGVCGWKDCAAHVTCTVVSKRKDDYIVIDGGSKTFATDAQPNNAPLNMKGFGRIVGYPNAVFIRMNEEHGIIELNGEVINIGDTINIIPNHICSTVNLHNYLYLKTKFGNYEKKSIVARGKLQ